jgi:hypothetical protein
MLTQTSRWLTCSDMYIQPLVIEFVESGSPMLDRLLCSGEYRAGKCDPRGRDDFGRLGGSLAAADWQQSSSVRARGRNANAELLSFSPKPRPSFLCTKLLSLSECLKPTRHLHSSRFHLHLLQLPKWPLHHSPILPNRQTMCACPLTRVQSHVEADVLVNSSSAETSTMPLLVLHLPRLKLHLFAASLMACSYT